MSSPDPQQRLRALAEALGAPNTARVMDPSDEQQPAPAADIQRIGTASVDELLRRVSAVTSVLGGRGGGDWDEIDRLAARLLLADLAVVAATTRALNDLAASRLSTARADLASARADLERVVKEAAGG